jgi:hypothetical protein
VVARAELLVGCFIDLLCLPEPVGHLPGREMAGICALSPLSAIAAGTTSVTAAENFSNSASRLVLKGGVIVNHGKGLNEEGQGRRAIKSLGAKFFSPAGKPSVVADSCTRRGPLLPVRATGSHGQANMGVVGSVLAEEDPVKSFKWPDSKVG